MKRTLRLDLHIHTTASPDSSLEPSEVLASVRRAGLDGFAITDHNSMAALPEVERRLAEEVGASGTEGPSPLLLIPGVEVSTREGHLLAYFVPHPPEEGRSLQHTVEEVHRLGGMVSLAHPFRRAHGAGRSLGRNPTLQLDMVETMNGHNDATANSRAKDLARRLGLPATGGSDAHASGEVGTCYVEVDLSEAVSRRSLLSTPLRTGGKSLTLGGGLKVWAGNARKRAGRGLKPL